MFKSGRVFLWTLISDHGDQYYSKSTVGGEFLFVIFVEANYFSDMRRCVDGIDRSGYGICGWYKWVDVVERIEI